MIRTPLPHTVIEGKRLYQSPAGTTGWVSSQIVTPERFSLKTAVGVGIRQTLGGAKGLTHAVGRVPSRGGKDAALPSVPGRGVMPLDVIQPEPRRLCHVSAG